MIQLQVAHNAPVFKILSYYCFNSIALPGKTAATATTDNPAITAKTADFQLSQEESGISLIIQDVSKDDYVVQLKQDKVCFTNL